MPAFDLNNILIRFLRNCAFLYKHTRITELNGDSSLEIVKGENVR